MASRRLLLAAFAGVAAAGCGDAGVESTGTAQATTAAAPAAARGLEWPTFDRTASRTGSTDASIGITSANAAKLRRRAIDLPGTVDSSPIGVGGKFVMTTTYGRTLAVDAHTGRVAWTFTPSSYDRVKGTAQFTNASPTASPDRRFVFSASPDGRVHKLSLATGREAGGRWPVTVTRDPTHEKLTSSFNLARGLLVVTTGGYIGDAPPYQGHVVTIEPGSGRVRGVFNSLCADRHLIIEPSTCRSSDSAIWARSGAVVAPDGSLLVTTGNAPFDGRRDFGDSVLRLTHDARRLLGSFTPTDHEALDAGDTDLGSTAPVLIGGGSILQSGKDAKLHVIRYSHLRRIGRTGGEIQVLPAPGGGMFSAPAVWRHSGRTFVFATTFGGTAAYEQRAGRLHRLWQNGTGGTSPIVVGGLLYVYDPEGALVVYAPVTGRRLARVAAGAGHWNSPVPGDGVIAVPEGNANDHVTSGTLGLYSVG